MTTSPRRPILSLRRRSNDNQPGRTWYIEANSAMAATKNTSLEQDTIAPYVPTTIFAKAAWMHPKRRLLTHSLTIWMRSSLRKLGLLFFYRLLFYLPRILLLTTGKQNVYSVGTQWMSMHQDSRQRPSTSVLHVLTALSAKYVRKT